MFIVLRHAPSRDPSYSLLYPCSSKSREYAEQLLTVLAARHYNDRYVRIRHAFSILETCDIEIDVAAEPEALLQELLERQLFTQARRFAEAYQLSQAKVSLAEAHVKMNTFLASKLSTSRSARRVVLRQCEALLEVENCDCERVGQFFLQLAEGDRATPFSVPEKILILSRGLDWLQRNNEVSARNHVSGTIRTAERKLWSLRIAHEAARYDDSTTNPVLEAEQDSYGAQGGAGDALDRSIPDHDETILSLPGEETTVDIEARATLEDSDQRRAEMGVRGWGTAEVSSPLNGDVIVLKEGDQSTLRPAELAALSRLLKQLLDRGYLSRAVHLAQEFGQYHVDLITVQLVFYLAQVRQRAVNCKLPVVVYVTVTTILFSPLIFAVPFSHSRRHTRRATWQRLPLK